jgi:type IV secretion system protein VirB10
VGVLNEELSTKLSKDRDRFTLTVSEPSKYAGATIEGYVTNVKRSGKITGRSEMTFNFDRIHLANGRSYKFAGIVETLRTAGGEKVSVDNEGAIKEGETRTSTTGKRAAVGTAVGAIIGAIAGGGKGAAIGAIVGAGAGAGSVYIQGRDDLELAKGTEVSLRATAPAQ